MVRAALAIAVVTSAIARTATADPIVWRAPADCPAAADVRARVEQRLGGPIALGGEVRVDVRRERDYVATVDFRGITVANDVRTLHGNTCDELADAVAIILARVASEHVGDLEKPEDAVAVRGRPDAAVAAVGAAMPDDRGPREWGYGLRFLGLSGVGGVPEVGLGGEAAAHVRHRDFFAEVAFAHWLPSHKTGGVDVGMNSGDARAGWSPMALPIRAWLTGEYAVYAANVDGGMRTQQTVGFGGGFGVAWPVSTFWRVVGSVEFILPLERATFRLSSGSTPFQAWPMTPRAAFGLEVGFE